LFSVDRGSGGAGDSRDAGGVAVLGLHVCVVTGGGK